MTIAFTFTTNDFEYVALEGPMDQPILRTKGKIVLPTNYTVPQTVEWFENELELLLNNLRPNTVNYRLTINNVTNNYVSNVYYGQAILNLLCQKKGIEIFHVAPASIKPGKFNLPKETNVINYIEGLLGNQSAPWDKSIKTTALMALMTR
ncbi:hypothetical protein EGY07_15440 [Chryseobacterium indologenes]|uniref:hypothetical protein n=1 Tax=Chryseobacterium TaxID=59732 RepID=UPI000F4E41E3|nr:hypothetical protein [Chryseobacterium indologenes]AYZ36860.1 hypothetical protein EGY07_15440 [Chryseobacterium indologenes]MBF6645648.1 hypothetical protein [Chryseobacterium indologenes]MBU3049111.1 hypothetical protein [Chryseobacterium indologenes]MEB4763179.1 hypothetical protein [Chryseobacterium indologenes]QQQ70680.1 hypothetical protein JHW31_19740 [Chryseobacterium indologenes]